MLLAHDSLTVLIAGNAHPRLADKLARELNLLLLTPQIGEFADGETQVYIAGGVRGRRVVIVQPTCTPVNDHLMILALLADAARAAGAAQIIAVAPYFGYARQDQRARSGDPRSAQVAGRLLASIGVDQLVTLDLHSSALESAFPMPAMLLQPDELFVPEIISWNVPQLVIVSPDAGGMKRAQRYATALKAPIAVIAKDRTWPDYAEPLYVLGDVRSRPCLIVDDMASTGRTLAGAAEALRRAGASEIYGAFTHAVMAPGAEETLIAAQFKKLIVSDSIPVSAKPWLNVLSATPLLNKALRSLGVGSERAWSAQSDCLANGISDTELTQEASHAT
jgi:ribose-phosphate pyrophosphokinase